MNKFIFFNLLFLFSLIHSKAQSWINIPFTVLESQCSLTPTGNELYISQVYDNDLGSYGAVQIYNPTNYPINLSNYGYRRRTDYGSGAWSSNINLQGSIPPRSIYLIGVGINDESQIVCSGVPYDLILVQSHGINFNDQLQLLKNGNVIDDLKINKTGTTIIRKLEVTAPKQVFNTNDWYFGEPNCVTVGTLPELDILRVERNIQSPNFSFCFLPAQVRLILGGGSGKYQVSNLDGNTFTDLNSPWIINPNFTSIGNKIYTIRDKNNPHCYLKISFNITNLEIQTSPIINIP